MSLTVIVPSRGRPQNIERLIGDWIDTATSDAMLSVRVDEDDPELEGYLKIKPRGFLEIEVQPFRGLNRILNAAAVIEANYTGIVGFMGDDHAPRTIGWDQTIEQTLHEKTGVAYGNDLLMGEQLPTAVFITSDLIRTLGWYSPPALTHLCLDVFWKLLGETTSLHYLPDVIIEHLHPANGKAEFDERYAAVNNPEMVKSDADAWYFYRDNDWIFDRARLHAAGLVPALGGVEAPDPREFTDNLRAALEG